MPLPIFQRMGDQNDVQLYCKTMQKGYLSEDNTSPENLQWKANYHKQNWKSFAAKLNPGYIAVIDTRCRYYLLSSIT